MGGGTPKQFRDWGGVTLLEATLRAFLAPGMPDLAGIALAVPEDRLAEVRAWRFPVPHWAVAGGATRQASVALALAALPDVPSAPVLIHDAVRPFPPALPVHGALAALETWDGAVLGEPSTDTLKRVDAQGLILGTEPREGIFRAQTPQVARLGLWREAFRWAEARGFAATDDVSLLEAMGLRVKLVPSPPTNLKLTTPEDWDRWHPGTTGCGGSAHSQGASNGNQVV
ncbi:2-C-methyl-D-erythritol 4-phosphate cytidylyltransferase [Mesoterricola silvestris]|uniref:2-C-methyl-D-erythritol 4-phosphate cytidylyltransferase n=2 Tax=Mesoterricola silvestris TaxID=2927979 RepID=A0AA48GPQ5_9BACT|nr:2-C-methyl-D-erythritol 4-phosphate cytidylyltransferase [Mesoterricola silvestris]